MYKKVDASLNFLDREKEVLKFWDEEKVFEIYDNAAKISLRPMQIVTFRFGGSDENKSIL